jgi:hypothetical protein
MQIRVFLALLFLAIPFRAVADTNVFERLPFNEPAFFPIAVWLQSPQNAQRYRDAGINTYVGLWRGPTEEQLTQLKSANLKLICSQNSTALAHLDDATIIAWMHGDEPDNAQSQGQGKGYGPPISPEKIIADYERLRAKDPSRPILLNLGQGVAYDNYIGRGVRRNHPEDYPEYIKGCDIASFDIYPVVNESKEVQGKLDFVPRGVERLKKWAGDSRRVWNCVECTHISSDQKAMPEQVRSEVWMSLIHGSQGIIYFVHQFKPTFREAALLDDPEMLKAVTALNHQITELAPVLNSPSLTNIVKTRGGDLPIATMTKQKGVDLYLFAAAMKNQSGKGAFEFTKTDSAEVEVLGESRALSIKAGAFEDDFSPYAVHLYRIRARSSR